MIQRKVGTDNLDLISQQEELVSQANKALGFACVGKGWS